MRNLKKVLSLVLAMVMVLSMMVTANAAFADQDSINADYAEAVAVMAELGILQGDGTNYNPDGTLNRAEAAVILSKAHSGKSDVKFFEGETKYISNPFTDVNNWATPYVLYCYANGIVGGKSATSYDPKGTLTGYEFAKMLLVAAGYGTHADYLDDDTQTWKMKTLAAAKDAKLLANLDIDLNENISREEAAEMAMAAMKAGGEVTTTYYVVKAAAEVETGKAPATADILNVSGDAMDAYFMATILGEEVAKVHTVVKVDGGLLTEKFGVEYGTATDYYGRTASTYYIPDAYGDVYPMFFPVAATLVYDNTTSAAVVAADLKGYKMKDANGDYYTVGRDTVDTWEVSYYVDGTGSNTSSSDVAAKTISNLTGPNTVVEVYTNTKKQITNVVLVNSYINEVEDVIEADYEAGVYPVAILKTGEWFLNLDGYKKGDVVSYNVDASYAEGGLINVAPATGFTGVASSYSVAQGVTTYTINGAKYVLDGYAAGQANTVKGTIAKADELVYYPGANGSVLYVDTLAPEAAPVITDYAYVLDTAAWKTSAGNGIYALPTYAAEIEVLLADGSTEIWSVALTRAAKAIKHPVTGATLAAQGDVYYVLNGVPNVIEGIDGMEAAELDTVLEGLEDGIFTYADKALVANVANFEVLDEDEAGAELIVSDGIVKTDLLEGAAVLNSKTVFVVADGEGGYTTITGVANLGETEILSGATVVATKTVALVKGVYVPTYIGTLVYATDTTIAEESAVEDVDNLVLNLGTYTVTYDTKGVAHYTYTAVNAKGEYVSVEGTGAETLGVYTLSDKDTLYTNVTVNAGTVVAIHDTTVMVKLANNSIVPTAVTGKTTVVDMVGNGLVPGATIIWAAGIVYVVG